eukprot:5784799-Lingulodinium_polyedra.AAC.1
MTRYQFRLSPKSGTDTEAWLNKHQRYIKVWIELMIAEKTRQTHLPNEFWPVPREQWPWTLGHA